MFFLFRSFTLCFAGFICIVNLLSYYFFSLKMKCSPSIESMLMISKKGTQIRKIDPALAKVIEAKKNVKLMSISWTKYLQIQARFKDILLVFEKSRRKKPIAKSKRLEERNRHEEENKELLKNLSLSSPIPLFGFLKDIASMVVLVASIFLKTFSNIFMIFGCFPFKLIFVVSLLLPFFHLSGALKTHAIKPSTENAVQLRLGFLPPSFSVAPMAHVQSQRTRSSLKEFVYPR